MTTDHGEPWRKHGTDASKIVIEEYGVISNITVGRHRDKILRCVNACAGINDPGRAIEAARVALQKCFAVLESPELSSIFALAEVHGTKYAGPTVNSRKIAEALALLGDG